MKRTLAILALLLAAASSLPGISRAAPAPDFKIARVLNGPVAKINSVKDLKGKVVFLDFWATWCGPCVASLPHMNRLHDALKDEPVVFIAVTDESTGTVTTFLKTHEIKSWVGIDEKGSSFKAYKVRGRPDGYLIGKDGNLLARISPAHLKEKDVREAIAGTFKPRPIEWEETKAQAKPAGEGRTIFEIRISTAFGKRRMSSSFDKLEMGSMPFKNNIAFIWNVEDSQVILDTQPVDAFNVTLKTPPDGFGQGREVLKSAIQAAFDIRVTPEQTETDVYILTLSTVQGAPRPKPGAPEVHLGLMSYGGGQVFGTAGMPEIARGIWASTEKPVVDETGLEGGYEFELTWTYGVQAELDSALAKEGLVLTPARRTLEFLRVTPAKPDGK